jgi:hypothetical protein
MQPIVRRLTAGRKYLLNQSQSFALHLTLAWLDGEQSRVEFSPDEQDAHFQVYVWAAGDAVTLQAPTWVRSVDGDAVIAYWVEPAP